MDEFLPKVTKEEKSTDFGGVRWEISIGKKGGLRRLKGYAWGFSYLSLSFRSLVCLFVPFRCRGVVVFVR